MRILYLSYSRLENSVNAVYLRGLQQNGTTVLAYQIDRRGLAGYCQALRYGRINQAVDWVMIGYESPELVVLAKLFSRQPIIFNALCSTYERIVLARGLANRFSLKTLYYWLLDWLAVHCANLVMLESNQQLAYWQKLFRVTPAKLFRAWTGVDEGRFFYDPAVAKLPRFTVVFRGYLIPESGAEYLVEAAQYLRPEPIDIIMLANGPTLAQLQQRGAALGLTNLQFVTGYQASARLRRIMQQCHLSIGQLSAHARLTRTIPHKCYEALALGLPYLTAANAGVLELLTPGENCLTCRPADPCDLAERISWAKNHPVELARIAQQGRQLFQDRLTAKHLARALLNRLSSS